MKHLRKAYDIFVKDLIFYLLALVVHEHAYILHGFVVRLRQVKKRVLRIKVIEQWVRVFEHLAKTLRFYDVELARSSRHFSDSAEAGLDQDQA